jgi:hypothetical protein
MTKFGKTRKTEPSGFLFWTIWFRQFQSKTKEGAKLEDLKIQDVLKNEKGLKGIKVPRWKKTKQEAEVTKIGQPNFGYRNILFSHNR